MIIHYCDFCGEEIEAPGNVNTCTIDCTWDGLHGHNEQNFEACYTCFDKIYTVIDKKLLRKKK